MSKKLKPGMLCAFDPYNVLNNKESYNCTYTVQILKVYKRFGRVIGADCRSCQTCQLLTQVPATILYEISDLKPVIEVRNPIDSPVIDDDDIRLLDYLSSQRVNEKYRSNILLLKAKLEFYRMSRSYYDMIYHSERK